MATTSFHDFTSLPNALQDRIWKMAAQDSRPAAHFFTYFDCDNRNESKRFGDRAIRLIDGSACALAVPDFDNPTSMGTAQPAAPSSTYLVNGGLLGASKRSREVMHQTCGILTSYAERCPSKYWVLGSFRHSGETTYITTQPDSDLFCLRVLDFKSFNWDRGCFDFSSLRPRLIDYYVDHVGLEFDRSWRGLFQSKDPNDPNASHSDQDKAVYRSLAAISNGRLHWINRVWFIDYSIQRRPSIPRTSKNRQEFSCATGRLLEVEQGDSGWDLTSSSAHNFVLQMEDSEKVAFCLEDMGIDPDNDDVGAPNPILGVLAFEAFN